LRITGGSLKGLKLITPSAKSKIRPLLDKTRQTIFNILGQYLDGLTILDCFGGTGSFSIESISRNANFVYIIEQSSEAINIIKNNFEKSGIAKDKFLIKKSNFWIEIDRLDKQFDIIFFDPPYQSITVSQINNFLKKSKNIAKEYAIIILKIPISIQDSDLNLNNFKVKIKKDGITKLIFLEKG